jgi:histidinol phosphatase-like PHP family hydrolase
VIYCFKFHAKFCFVLQVFESDQVHRQIVMELHDKLTVLEHEASRHQQILDSTSQKNKGLIDKLQEDKAMLEVSTRYAELLRLTRSNTAIDHARGLGIAPGSIA